MLDPVEHSGVEMQTETISAYLPRVFSEDPSEEGGDTRDQPGGGGGEIFHCGSDGVVQAASV